MTASPTAPLRQTDVSHSTTVTVEVDSHSLLRRLSASGELGTTYCTYAAPEQRWIWSGALAVLNLTLTGEGAGAGLNGANLNGANLNGASLNGANLNGASLNGASLNGATVTARAGALPFRQLGTWLAQLELGGWRGWGVASFELAYLREGRDLPEGVSDTAPLLTFVVPESEISVRPGEVRIRSTDASSLHRLREAVLAAAAHPVGDGAPPVADPVSTEDGSRPQYESAVAAAVSAIGEGALQKLILSRRVGIPFDVDMLGTYLSASRANTPARSFLLSTLGGGHALGFSPELVCAVNPAGRVVTEPLAGTRARGPDSHGGPDAGQALRLDPKERFEHAISVDESHAQMMSVCEPYTVSVFDPARLVARGPVVHLGSRLEGHLSRGRSRWDALDTLFPAVTATGLERAAALDHIRRLEYDQPRGLYAGAVLTADSDGALEAALVLRSLFSDGERSWLRAGAGIVSESTPAREWMETCEKLSSIAPYVVRARGTAMGGP